MGWLSDLLGTTGKRLKLPAAGSSQDAVSPFTPSSDYTASVGAWSLIADILAGAAAVRAQKQKYLPQYPNEDAAEYARRVAVAPWRPEFEDTHRSLSSKPFSRPITFAGNAPAALELFADDVDGAGNAMTVFARGVFERAVAKGFAGILVDFTKTPNAIDGRPLTLADERQLGARPYWVSVRPEDVLALYTEERAGHVVTTHLRLRECSVEREGFGERHVERVRVFNQERGARPPTWQLFEKIEGDVVLVGEGSLTIDVIPFVPLFLGERTGQHKVKPPLLNLAEMQLELYRALSREDEIMTYAGSPILVATGMNPPEATPSEGGRPKSQIVIGPKSVLFAPPTQTGAEASWDYIAPDANLVEQVAKSPERITQEFRRLAMQPMMPRTGNLTATSAAIDASKAHSAVQAWAGLLKDCLDQALALTAKWLGVADRATVNVHTDFSADIANAEEMKVLGEAAKAGVISKKRNALELARRGTLGPDYTYDEDQEQLAEEQQGLEPEEDIDPRTGSPVIPFDRSAA